jgi:hypothetical protein
MSNSRDRRRLRRAGLLPMPALSPRPISIASSTSEKIPLSDGAKLLRALFASGAFVLFVPTIYEYLALAGVVDSMIAARIVLIFAVAIGFLGVLVSEIMWGKTLKRKVLTALFTAVVLALGLWALDAWTVSYRNAHSTMTLSAQISSTSPLPFSAMAPTTSLDPMVPRKRHARIDPKHEHCPTIFEGFGARSIDGTTVDQMHITTDASCVSIADVDKLKDSHFGPITVQQNAKGTQPKP